MSADFNLKNNTGSISFITAPEPLLEYPLGQREPPQLKREAKILMFSRTTKKLIFAYIVFIALILIIGTFPDFLASMIFNFFSFFGETGEKAFYALKMPYFAAILLNILIFSPFFFYYASEKDNIKGTTETKLLKISRVPAAFIFFFGAIFAVNILLNIVMGAFFSSDSASSVLPSDSFGVFFSFLSIAIVPAFIEELVFRHIILRSLLKYNKYFAVLCSSILFALAHFSMEQNMFAVFFGIMVGFVYVKTESVIPGIILHMLNNAFSTFHSYSVQYFSDSFTNAVYVFMLITVFLSLFIGIYYIFNFKASPFYIGDKEFSDTVLSSGEISGELLKMRLLYILIVNYIIISAALML